MVQEKSDSSRRGSMLWIPVIAVALLLFVIFPSVISAIWGVAALFGLYNSIFGEN